MRWKKAFKSFLFSEKYKRISIKELQKSIFKNIPCELIIIIFSYLDYYSENDYLLLKRNPIGAIPDEIKINIRNKSCCHIHLLNNDYSYIINQRALKKQLFGKTHYVFLERWFGNLYSIWQNIYRNSAQGIPENSPKLDPFAPNSDFLVKYVIQIDQEEDQIIDYKIYSAYYSSNPIEEPSIIAGTAC